MHKLGVLAGEGTMKFKDTQCTYSGTWLNGMQHGNGELHYATGAVFKGKFLEGEIVTGHYIDSEGSVFETLEQGSDSGHYVKSRLQGYGKAVYKGGDTYTGMFRDGKRSGKGTMLFNQFNEAVGAVNQAKYEGDWKFNKRNGVGEMTWSDGSKFAGTWVNDCRTQGTHTMTDGTVYKGHFKNDKFHGIGSLVYAQKGVTFSAIFNQGAASNIGKLTYAQKNQIYFGEVENLQRQGVGILIDPDAKLQYEG